MKFYALTGLALLTCIPLVQAQARFSGGRSGGSSGPSMGVRPSLNSGFRGTSGTSFQQGGIGQSASRVIQSGLQTQLGSKITQAGQIGNSTTRIGQTGSLGTRINQTSTKIGQAGTQVTKIGQTNTKIGQTSSLGSRINQPSTVGQLTNKLTPRQIGVARPSTLQVSSRLPANVRAPRNSGIAQVSRTAYASTFGAKLKNGFIGYKGMHHCHWTARHFCPRWNCPIFFCPCACCWYYWCPGHTCFLPVNYLPVCPPTVIDGTAVVMPDVCNPEIPQEIPEVPEEEIPDLPDLPG